LICPQCARTLTGSASTGRHGGKFFYYHCSNNCKERQKAQEMNDKFLNVLKGLKANPEAIELYGEILKQSLKENNQVVQTNLNNIAKDIEKQKQRLKNARALMMDGEIKPDDYNEMKSDIETLINESLVKQILLKGSDQNYDKQIDFCVKLLKDIDTIYQNATTEHKQRIIGSMFPERLVFEKNNYRTPKLNQFVFLVCSDKSPLKGLKKGKHAYNCVLSREVVL
jgi:site-specific DNA recombinase